MPHNSEIIISDTSCLILLNKIKELELLRLMASKALITPSIKKEFGEALPSWIEIKAPKDKHYH